MVAYTHNRQIVILGSEAVPIIGRPYPAICPVQDSAPWSACGPRNNTKQGASLQDSEACNPLVCRGY